MAGRAVLVTGGTKGLGRGIASAYLAAGADVMVCARTEAPPVVVSGRAASFTAADLRDPAQASAVVAAAHETFGRLDVVVNNAGGSPPSDIATASPRFVEKIIGLNLLAPLWISQAAHSLMSQQADGGVIVNIGSLSGTRPSPGTAAYGAAKAGLANLTGSLAMEWAPKVRVNLITVGYLMTEQAELFYGDEAGIAAVAQTIPMGRLVEPADVAAACLFLSSEAARFITGADIRVDGGGERPPFLTGSVYDPTVTQSEPQLRAVDGRVPGRRGLATRSKLLECTTELLATTPYRDLKITDITRAAGTSPATFYQYFVDLETVLLAVAEQTAEQARELSELITSRPWKGAKGVASAEDLVDGFLDFWHGHRPALRVIDLLSTEGDKRFRVLRVVMLNGMTRALATEIAALQEEKQTAEDSAIDPMAMAGALIGMLPHLAGHQSGFEAWDIPFSHVREAMIRLIYWGVTGPKVPSR